MTDPMQTQIDRLAARLDALEFMLRHHSHDTYPSGPVGEPFFAEPPNDDIPNGIPVSDITPPAAPEPEDAASVIATTGEVFDATAPLDPDERAFLKDTAFAAAKERYGYDLAAAAFPPAGWESIAVAVYEAAIPNFVRRIAELEGTIQSRVRTFAEVVESDPAMSDADKAYWLTACHEEGLIPPPAPDEERESLVQDGYAAGHDAAMREVQRRQASPTPEPEDAARWGKVNVAFNTCPSVFRADALKAARDEMIRQRLAAPADRAEMATAAMVEAALPAFFNGAHEDNETGMRAAIDAALRTAERGEGDK